MFEGLFQPMHLLVILAIVLIIFGPGKLAQIGAGLGKSIREFKKALSEMDKPLFDKESASIGDEQSSALHQRASAPGHPPQAGGESQDKQEKKG